MNIHFSTIAPRLLVAVLATACSPNENWRELRLEGTSWKVQLPCKPDRTTRTVPMGEQAVELHVVGCESGTTVVAVMTAPLRTGVDATALLARWQKATLLNAQVDLPLNAQQRQTWHRAGMLPLTSSVRIQAQARKADGQTVVMDAVWGAMAEGDQVRVIHAVVYDRAASSEMANTLFEGITP